jgi:hypothetical protein
MSGNASEKELEKIGRIIDEFLINVKGGFTLEELIAYTRNDNKKTKHPPDISPEELDSGLRISGQVFINEDGSFTPRAIFFKDAEFIISPTQEEIDGSFLIPGYRFTPFCSDRISPWEYVLLNGERKETPGKIIREKMAVLAKYYTILGAENMINLFSEDQESNADVFTNVNDGLLENKFLDLRVFELDKLFRDRKLSEGDKMLLKVDDWSRGIFTYEYLSKEEYGKLEKRKAVWSKKLEEGFAKTFDRFGVLIPITEQLAYAYFYAGAENLKSPASYLGQFFNETKHVFLIQLGMESKIWKEKEIDISLLEYGDNIEDAPDSLNGILAYLGVMFKDSDIEGFMRDELFRRRGEMDDGGLTHMMDRLFPEGEPNFESLNQKELFLKLCGNLWKKVSKSYNYFSDQESGKLRGEVAEILEIFFKWFYSYSERYANINEKDIPLQEITMLVQGTTVLTDIFHMLNSPKRMNKDETEKIKKMLPIIIDSIKDRQQELEIKTRKALLSARKTKGGSRNLSLVKPEKGEDDSEDNESDEFEARYVFVLKVSIKGISPQIWRSIQVPGSYTLGDLHNIIQIAMGWDMAHMHIFEIDKVQYGPDDKDFDNSDLFDFNEEDFTLDELELNEKQRFSYTYDFGDDWKHQILVSKIIPASKAAPIDRTKPLCLNGKRACPPEDIGGIYGYEELLDKIKNDPDNMDAEMEWLKGYDSEYCNVDEINRELRKGGV